MGKGASANLRAQASIETMLILAAVLVMILAVGLLLPAVSAGGEHLRQVQAARAAAQEVASAADEVYLAGDGASKSIEIEMPASFEPALSFIGNRTASTPGWKGRKLADLYVAPSGDIFAVSRAPMCGRWPAASGKYRINVTFNSSTPAHVAVNANC